MWDDLKNIITTIDWKQFHFLRPNALYLFIPVGVIVLLLLAGNREQRKWKHIIQPALRPFMFSKASVWAILLPLLLFIIGSSFAIIGLAGPTWKKKNIPGEKIQAVALIALDLSRSMLATDIQPNRLERAKFKISDFLDANPRARAGLVAFAGTAHPVLPFTNDYNLIKHHAASLVNRIMPVQGTDIVVLLQMIDTMMKNIQAPSTIVLMTDEITQDDAVLLSNYIHSSIHRLEILLFSTPQGAPIPGYAKVVSKQDPSIVQNLVQDTSIIITPITLDKSDVQSIAKRISDRLVFQKEKNEDEKDWDDMGWLLLIPALIITLFWFRKGWVIHWCWLPLSLLLFTSCGVNSKHPDWWYSKDYQGQLLENAKRFDSAAETYTDDKHKAIAYFKAGNYEAAADLFALDTSAASTYDRGLALAKLGRYDEAMNAFDHAINLDPSLKAVAANSIAKTKSAKQRADSITKYDPRSVGKNMKNIAGAQDKKKEKKELLKERKAQSGDEQLSSDTRVKELPKFGNRVTDETASNIHMGKEAKTPPKDFNQQKPAQTSEQILMRQTEADPSEFLHRRFELQEKRYYKNIKRPKDPW
ncbi:MAG TPA: VWA domain-containing protein [Chitinophagaceae bacterium]